MPKICVEREANFYLIDLNEEGTVSHSKPLRPFYFPSPMATALNSGTSEMSSRYYLRYDGVYIQKTRDEEDFFAFYRFFRGGKVTIVTTSQHKLLNKVNNTYEVLSYPLQSLLYTTHTTHTTTLPHYTLHTSHDMSSGIRLYIYIYIYMYVLLSILFFLFVVVFD